MSLPCLELDIHWKYVTVQFPQRSSSRTFVLVMVNPPAWGGCATMNFFWDTQGGREKPLIGIGAHECNNSQLSFCRRFCVELGTYLLLPVTTQVVNSLVGLSDLQRPTLLSDILVDSVRRPASRETSCLCANVDGGELLIYSTSLDCLPVWKEWPPPSPERHPGTYRDRRSDYGDTRLRRVGHWLQV